MTAFAAWLGGLGSGLGVGTAAGYVLGGEYAVVSSLAGIFFVTTAYVLEKKSVSG